MKPQAGATKKLFEDVAGIIYPLGDRTPNGLRESWFLNGYPKQKGAGLQQVVREVTDLYLS